MKAEKNAVLKRKEVKKKDGKKGDNFLIAMYFHSL